MINTFTIQASIIYLLSYNYNAKPNLQVLVEFIARGQLKVHICVNVCIKLLFLKCNLTNKKKRYTKAKI